MRYLLFLFLLPLFMNSQQTNKVDYKRIQALIDINQTNKSVKGSMDVTFKILKATDSVYLDAVGMDLRKPNSKRPIKVKGEEDKIWFIADFKAGKTYDVSFDYSVIPLQTLYFTGNQVWTQGQGKYTSHWLPSIDDMNDKIEFDLAINAAHEQKVISNGALKKLTPNMEEETITWYFDMTRPMSSYLVAVAIGDFKKSIVQSDTGVPIELHIKKEDSLKFEPTYRYTKEIFDFLENEIGVPYPWQNYKQVPVRDFLYAGMENTTATIFSEAFVVDSIAFTDRNYVNVNAHELAHHWFGNLVTETSGTHHWLQEGFATYYALLAERSLFGDDYYYWRLYNTAESLKSLSDSGKGESLMNPKASSLTFYEKGAWALHLLRELIGDFSFKVAIKNYLEKYQFKNVSTENFLAEVRKASSVDISEWEKDWLQQTAFKAEQAYKSLRKSAFIEQYFELQRLRSMNISEKKEFFLKNPKLLENDYLGQEVIYQLANEPMTEVLDIYLMGFNSGNLYVRQAIALSMEKVPGQLLSEYETLLNDDSYSTQESALYNLWRSFPQNRSKYLDKLKDVHGFQNKNIRMIWLALALNTEGYMESASPIFKTELRDYSSSEYSFEIRQNAFDFINSLGLYNDYVIDNLINASVHHQWRFRNFARSLLKEVLKNPGTKDAIVKRVKSFTEKEQNYLQKEFIKK